MEPLIKVRMRVLADFKRGGVALDRRDDNVPAVKRGVDLDGHDMMIARVYGTATKPG
jgi:hypothetical protein